MALFQDSNASASGVLYDEPARTGTSLMSVSKIARDRPDRGSIAEETETKA